MPTIEADLLRGVAAIGAELGLSRPAAQRRITERQIPTFRLGRTVCARRSTLGLWLAECEAKARAGD